MTQQYPYGHLPAQPPVKVPVSPEVAYKSYLTGRWIVFIMVSAMPTLFFSNVPGVWAYLGLSLLSLPAYFTFKGIKDILSKGHATGDTNYTPIWLAQAAVAFASALEFSVATTGAKDLSLVATLVAFSVFTVFTIWGVKLLETAAVANSSAVDSLTRVAASVAIVTVGSGFALTIISLLLLFVALPVALVILFTYAGEPAATLMVLLAFPLITGIITLIAAIKGRRNHLNALNANPALPNPVFKKKQAVLLSIACSSFFTIAVAILLTVFLTTQVHELMQQF